MSAPSKEEIAALVRVVAFQCGSGEAAQVAALADENERLRERNERLERACKVFEQASAASLADANKAEEEAKFLRAELDVRDQCAPDMMALAKGNERLRAERAECLALIDDGPEFFSDEGECDPHVDDEPCPHEPPCWSHRRRELLSKLRGQP